MTAPSDPPMPFVPLRDLTLIVATTIRHGIGMNGTLPWPTIKGEMAYFARLSQRTTPTQSSSSKPASSPPPPNSTPSRNAVLMGRKTYLSIPPRFRPLRNRLNVVLTRSNSFDPPPPPEVVVSASIDSALGSLRDAEREFQVGRIYVIGGADIYILALKQGAGRVLRTEVKKAKSGSEQDDWECDRFFPIEFEESRERYGDWGRWKRCQNEVLEKWTGEQGLGDWREDGDVTWRVGMWERQPDD